MTQREKLRLRKAVTGESRGAGACLARSLACCGAHLLPSVVEEQLRRMGIGFWSEIRIQPDDLEQATPA